MDKSSETILALAGIEAFKFHDCRHTFASWHMMNGGDLYELAEILGHSSIKMTQRYAKLAKTHVVKTGITARRCVETDEWRIESKSQTGSFMFPYGSIDLKPCVPGNC